jgi:16S rRNA (guanine527-N7)-methyltransferase
MSPPGRPKGEYRSAQREGNPMSRERGAPRNGDRSVRVPHGADRDTIGQPDRRGGAA